MERPSYWQAGTCCFAKSHWILHAAHEYRITGAFADEYVTDDDDGIADLNQPIILQHGQCRLDGGMGVVLAEIHHNWMHGSVQMQCARHF